MTSKEVIHNIKKIVARNGIMDKLISDNGPCYNSAEFAEFTRSYGFYHVTSSPMRPQSNGLAERSEQTIKKLMTKCANQEEDFHLALLGLRNTLADDAGSPVQRLNGRRTQALLPVTETSLKPYTIRPELVMQKLMNHKRNQKFYYDRTTRPLKAIDGQAIRMKTSHGWMPAQYMNQHHTPRSHTIRAEPRGLTYRRNRDQLITTHEQPHVIEYRPPPPPPPTHSHATLTQQ